MYFKRTMEQVVVKITRQFSVLLVTGARQAGKKTLLTRLSNDKIRFGDNLGSQ